MPRPGIRVDKLVGKRVDCPPDSIPSHMRGINSNPVTLIPYFQVRTKNRLDEGSILELMSHT